MKNSGIYRIVNLINGKIYIGSAINLKTRKRLHFSDLKFKKHHSSKLQNSYNIHGIENFQFEILEYCKKEKLIELEQLYLDTYKPYYNTNKTAGSRLGCVLSNDTKNKIRNSLIGTHHHTKETIDQIKKALSKPVLAINLSSGEITEYKSITEAALLLNISGNNITRIAKGKSKSAKNYTFVYKIKYNSEINYIITPGKTTQQVDMFDKNNVFKKSFTSIAKAANFIKADNSGISAVCRYYKSGILTTNGSKSLSYKGYIWKYKN